MALLPDEAPDGQHQVLGGSGRLAEPRGVDAGRRDLDQVVSGSFEQERAPCAVGGGKEQVDLGNRLPSLPAAAEAPVGISERDRLPDRQYEPEAQLGL